MWTLEAFNTMHPDAAGRILTACCASRPWADKLVSGRPYRSVAALEAAALAGFDELGEDELAVAQSAHPRIGGPITGDAPEWSRSEQSRAQTGDAGIRAALAEANAAYERRFGRVFLICATGLDAEHVLAEANRRLKNDDRTEAAESAAQLRKIVALRLGKAFGTERR